LKSAVENWCHNISSVFLTSCRIQFPVEFPLILVPPLTLLITACYWTNCTIALVSPELPSPGSVHTSEVVRSVSAPASRHQLIFKDCFSGVSQGSVLGPILFSVYSSPIGCIASDHGISLKQVCRRHPGDGIKGLRTRDLINKDQSINQSINQLHISVSTDDLTVQLSALESCLHSLHS